MNPEVKIPVNRFISVMQVCNTIALVIFGLLISRILGPFLSEHISGDSWILSIQLIVATIIVLLIYPIFNSIFFKNTNLFGKDALDYFIQKSIQKTPENSELDTEMVLFQNALEFSSVRVRDCIVPRTEIVAVSTSAPLDELLSKFIETGLSKILVFSEDIDNIIGYVHSSEMFTKPKDWTKSIISLSFVPENMAANKLMKSMLEEKRNISVVVDEFGGTSGMITLEDLVEEIFGEIEDEHDTRNFVVKQINETEYVLSGRAEIDQLNESYTLNIPESDDYQTIAGFILNHHQNFPKVNEVITIGTYTFKIIKMSNTKIELVRLLISK